MPSSMKQGRVDLAQLVVQIQAEFPDLCFAEAVLNDSGEDHAVVLLDDSWVFRFARTRAASARGASERRLLTALGEVSPIATPRYDHVCVSAKFGGYRMIAGRELAQSVFMSLSRVEQERVLSEIGAFLRVLHALPRKLVAGGSSGRASWLARRYGERREKLTALLGPDLIVVADRLYAALPSAVASNHATVIHGDFTENHILLAPNEGRLAGVIDFTDAALGDPALDFACLWAYGEWSPEYAARSYGVGAEVVGMISRSLWWFTRYRIDQLWWNVSDARDNGIMAIRQELARLFEALGL